MTLRRKNKHNKMSDDIIRREETPRLFRMPKIGRLWLLATDVRRGVEERIARNGPVVCASVDKQDRAMYMTNDPTVAQAFLDERNFTKEISKQVSLLWHVRSMLGNGLLTANTDDPDWKQARRIMTPVFGKQGTQLHFRSMCRTAASSCRLLDAHAASGKTVDLLDFAVRGTLHAILLALFGHESDLFDKRTADDHELSVASQTVLDQAVVRSYYPRFLLRLRRGDGGWEKADDIFHRRLGAFVDARMKAKSTPHKDRPPQDILQCMLDAGMVDDDGDAEALIRQLMLFIIAGHETTGSSIAFLLHTLARHPIIQERVALEAQRAGLGSGSDAELLALSPDRMNNLPYTDMVIAESARLNPAATALPRIARHAQTVTASNGCTFEVRKGDIGSVMISSLHRNREQWPDPDLFRPERFTEQAQAKRHAYAYLPFAAGARSCLGRAFATQELRLFTAVFAHRFHFTERRRSAVCLLGRRPIKTSFGLTMKPVNARVVVTQRTTTTTTTTTEESSLLSTRCAVSPASSLHSKKEDEKAGLQASTAIDNVLPSPPRVRVAYGSGHGQCRAMAFDLQQTLVQLGVPLAGDSCALDALPILPTAVSDVLLIVTSTYNGEPPDNALGFRAALDKARSNESWKACRYAVFGAGNAEWRATLHAFPRWIDDTLRSRLGAQPFFPAGYGDADDDLEGDWRTWLTALVARFVNGYAGCRARLTADVARAIATGSLAGAAASKLEVTWRPMMAKMCGDGDNATTKLAIVSVDELQKREGSGRSTLSVTLDTSSLPSAYEPGDHLTLWPQNPADVVEKIASKLNVALDDAFSVPSALSINPALAARTLQRRRTTTVRDALVHHIDMLCPPRKSNVADVCRLLEAHGRYAQSAELAELLDDDGARWRDFVDNHARTMAALFFHVASTASSLMFSDWLRIWPAMQPRRYSLASDDAADGKMTARILVSVQQDGQMGRFLSHVKPGTLVSGSIAAAPPGFRPPTAPTTTTQMVMIAAGTGLAPFLSFLERLERQRRVGLEKQTLRTTLVYGSRGPYDVLCAEQLQGYCRTGVLDELILAQSRVPQHGARYVGDAIRAQADTFAAALHDPNAVFFLCGASSTMAQNARQALMDVLQGGDDAGSLSALQSANHLNDLQRDGRLIEDTWG